jgi:pheromone shutdown-related protein TraB
LFGSFFFSGNDKPDDVNVEELKKSDAIDEMTGMFSKQLPAAKTVLIDERDSYLAYEVMNNLGEKTVAVVGAGHVKGILKKIQGSMSKEEHEAVKVIPPKSVVGKILTWGFPVLLIAIVGFGYLFGNREVALDMIYLWVLANGTLAALGCLISLAHPLTIVAGFVAAPITSLNPAIGAGFVTALVQTLLVKPRVRDLQQLQSGTMKFKHWWGNRLTKVFLVFILSSIGSSIGTFVAVPYLYKFFHG